MPDTTYYWKITEANGATTEYTSPVWSFKTAPYVNIDDFENYNNTANVTANGGRMVIRLPVAVTVKDCNRQCWTRFCTRCNQEVSAIYI